MTTGSETTEVLLRLSPAEALVFFEWLARSDDAGSLPVEDPAEQQVLWRLEGQLEKTLSAPFAPNYRELLDAARREVRGPPELENGVARDPHAI